MTIIETDPKGPMFLSHCGLETCVIALADYNEDEAVWGLWGPKFLSF